MTADVAPGRRRPLWWKRVIGIAFLVCLALVWWIWSCPTRVVLTDGRTFVIDKITLGPDHVAYAPFTFQRLWAMVSRRLKAWPNTSYQSQKGMVGVFYHSDKKQRGFQDNIFLIDRDGWWWEARQQGTIDADRRLAVFPPMTFPSSPRFEAWNDGAFMGSGPLRVMPPVVPIVERVPSPFPIRWRKGTMSIALNGVDVMTRDDVRPSVAEGGLLLETFNHSRPAKMRLTNFVLSDAMGRGSACELDEGQGFTTTVSPHGPYWHVTLLVWRDVVDPLEPEATFVFDPGPEGVERTKGAVGDAATERKAAQTEPENPQGPRWYDREVDGVGWRFAIVPPDATWVYRKRFSEGPEYKVEARGIPLLICEREPDKVAALRIEFRRPDGKLLYHAIVDGQPDKLSGRLQVGCPRLDPASPYEIRVGVHVPGRFSAVIRPRVVGKLHRSPPELVSPKPFP